MKKVTFPWAVLELTDDPHFAASKNEINNYGRLLYKQWSQKPRTYIDVGAKQGTCSTFMAAAAQQRGIVWAFEWRSNYWPVLLKNCTAQMGLDCASISVFPVAVSRCAGVEEWSVQQNELVDEPHERSKFVSIRTIALDDLTFPHRVEFINIDHELREIEVIFGAIQTILEHKPHMLVKVGSESNWHHLLDLCKIYGWQTEPWPDGHLFVRTAV